MDQTVFRWINGWSNDCAPFYDFLSEGSKWTWVRLLLGVLAVAMIVAGPKTRKAAILALIAFPIANGITDLFKDYLPMLRPCVELSDVHFHGVKFLDSFGTASAHAANTAAVAAVMTAFLKKWGAIPITISIFTGIARIYVGVHFPYQVLLGWLCGVGSGALVLGGWKLWEDKRRTPQKAQEPS